MRLKLIAFDLDGVLVKEPSAWWTLHRAFGTYERSKENLHAYETGSIDYSEFMRRDIRLWGRRTLHEVEAALREFTLTEDASEICNILRGRGYQLAIVSAGIDILAGAVAEELGIEHCVANGLEVDSQSFLTGEGVFRVDLLRKNAALKTLIRPLGLALSDVVAVGDSKYDIPFMEACSAGIAFVGHSVSSEHLSWPTSWPKIHRLEDLPQALSVVE